MFWSKEGLWLLSFSKISFLSFRSSVLSSLQLKTSETDNSDVTAKKEKKKVITLNNILKCDIHPITQEIVILCTKGNFFQKKFL